MTLQGRLAIYFAKFTDRIILKWSRGNGGVFPGYVARLIAPGILTELSGMIRKKIIVVMGTNGKTTVSNLLCHVLEEEGNTVVINRNGANMLNGIVSAFVLATNGKRRLEADYACIEVDEFAAEEVLRQLKPHCAVVTNLFRDQLDRFGEVDLVLERLRRALSSVPGMVLVLNCDDPVSYSLAYQVDNPVVTYGISQQFQRKSLPDGSQESTFCRICGKPLKYDFFHYGQLGVWRCPACKTARPEPDYSAEEIVFRKGSYSFVCESLKVDSGIRCSYNIYNTLAAYGSLSVMDGARGFEKALKSFDYGNRRENIFYINGGRVQLHLAKNPLGFQQKLFLLRQDTMPKDMIIQINDEAVDGRDVSWLWDVNFQHLEDAGIGEIIVDGSRRYDVGLRLKYEGIRWSFTKDVCKAINKITSKGTGNLYIIVNYSGLYKMNNVLNELQKIDKKGRLEVV